MTDSLLAKSVSPCLRQVKHRHGHFPHAGDSEFFEGDNLVGVKFLSHEGE